jgi:hypothetical protein
MQSLDRVPAIRRIETDRTDVFAIEIIGFVTGADVENLYGLMEGAYALHDKLDVLVRLKNYEGVEWENVSGDTTHEGRNHALQHVRRCAAVGDPDWTGKIAGFFEPEIPVELKHFALEDESAAWAWINAHEIPQKI